MSVYYMAHSIPGGKKRSWDLEEVVLHTVVSCYVGTGTQTWVLWKRNQ